MTAYQHYRPGTQKRPNGRACIVGARQQDPPQRVQRIKNIYKVGSKKMAIKKQFTTAQQDKITARADVYDDTADAIRHALTYTLYGNDGVHYTLKGYSNSIDIQDEYNAKMLLNANLKDIYALITTHVYNTAL